LKSTGIVRKVDELGRIVLPVELRRMLDISERDELEIYLDDDKIVLKRYEPSCIFCGRAAELMFYRGKTVCTDCAHDLNK